MTRFALRGNICYSRDMKNLHIVDRGYLVCEEGRSIGVFQNLPEVYMAIPCEDYGEALIIPGLIDLHIHGPQYGFRSLGMDMELLEWLETNAFPEEARFSDRIYAEKAYEIFAQAMKRSATTRASVFATVHSEATDILMDKLNDAGLRAFVGKVNMDRNAADYLCEASPEASIKETKEWLSLTEGKYPNIQPILTPRFIPTCSDELMKELGSLQQAYHLPVQSHLSENRMEVDWVKELCPDSDNYGDAYDQFGLFGGPGVPTVMAHCVYSSDDEIQLMKDRGVFVAHCPQSNTNLASGIAPIRKYLEKGLKVGLGSDVAGGSTESIFRAMADAIQVSKLYWRLVDHKAKPLVLEEVFFMATLGGGEFFGKVGSFEEGYALDAVVLDDSTLLSTVTMTTKERLERLVYLSDDRHIIGKYVQGRKII